MEYVAEAKVTQSCPTLCNPMNHIVHGVLSILTPDYWSGQLFPSPGDLPNPRSNPGLLHCRHILYQLSHKLRKCTKWGKTKPKKNYKDVGKGTQRENTLKTLLEKNKIKDMNHYIVLRHLGLFQLFCFTTIQCWAHSRVFHDLYALMR